MPEPQQIIDVEKWLAYLVVGGGGGGAGWLIKYTWDKLRQNRLDTWGEASQIIEQYKAQISELEKDMAAHKSTIVDLRSNLETERQSRWATEDKAAELRRRNDLLEEQVEQNERILDQNEQTNKVNAALLRHVYQCEVRARSLENNVRRLRQAVEHTVPIGPELNDWEELDAPDPEELERLRGLIEDSELDQELEEREQELQDVTKELERTRAKILDGYTPTDD